MSLRRRGAVAWLVAGIGVGVLACGDTDSPVDAGGTSCTSANARRVDAPVLQPVTLTGGEAKCVRLGAGRWLAVPQLAATTAPAGRYAVSLGPPAAPTSPLPGTVLRQLVEEQRPVSAPARFHARLRAEERASVLSSVDAGSALAVTRSVPALGSASAFSVLSTLDASPRFTTVTAVARYVGRHVVVYVDTAAPAVFSDADWAAFGRQYDDVLFPVATSTFGAPTDLDGNGRVLALFTPVVNALVTELECARSGYVNGFFYSRDLRASEAGSNAGEIVYGFVPDPNGRFSCRHTAAEVRQAMPATFIHELQHMLSFGAHVVTRGGAAEETWLNEGLSHLAEELGGLDYERRYPSPLGRSLIGQFFPDSAEPFHLTNLSGAFRWLSFPAANTLTVLDPGSAGSLDERAAAWLFLRWLTAQRDSLMLRRLVQTTDVGAANIAAAAGEPFARLFADFGAALWLDSLPGQPRDAVAPRYRFGGRNVRRLMLALHQMAPARAATPWSLAPDSASRTLRRVFAIPAGGLAMYLWRSDGDTPLHVARPDNRPLADDLGPQLVLVRLP